MREVKKARNETRRRIKREERENAAMGNLIKPHEHKKENNLSRRGYNI